MSSASFFGAILTDSNLSQDLDLRHPDLHQSGRAYQNYSFPFLECANLIGADLTGLPLGELQIKFSGSTYPYLNISVPSLTDAKINSSTIIKSIAISAKIVLSNDYVLKHEADVKLLSLTRLRDNLWNDPLRQGISPTRAVYSRFSGDYTDQNLAAIEISLVSQFDEKGLASLGEEAFHLRGFFNQPRLKVVPLYQQFSAAIEKLSEKAPTTKISKAESEKAAAYLKNAKPNDCDELSFISPMFGVGYGDDPGFDPHELDAQ